MNWKRHINVSNQAFRDYWVEAQFKQFSVNTKNQSCLDVGAGQQPYRKLIEDLNIEYFSHDFNKYTPTKDVIGFQNQTWKLLEHSFICEFLDIPVVRKYDFVLCTEVLEHVPDPIRAFEKLNELLAPGGVLILSVPLSSHVHQAPFYYSSGLSPWWFEYHAKRLSITNFTIEIHGDYADALAQDVSTYFYFKEPFRIKGISRMLRYLIKRLRFAVNPETLESGGFGTLFTAKAKIDGSLAKEK